METSRIPNDTPPKHRWSRPVVPTFTYILIYCRCSWMISCRCWLSGDHSCGDHTSSKTQNHHHQHSAELQHVWCIFPYILKALCTLDLLYIYHHEQYHCGICTYLKQNCTSFTQQHVYMHHFYWDYVRGHFNKNAIQFMYILVYIYKYMNTNLYTYTYVISRLLTQLHILESWNPEKISRKRGMQIAT